MTKLKPRISVDAANKLTTRRLLTYFKKAKRRTIRFRNQYYCSECDEYHFHNISDDEQKEFFREFLRMEQHIGDIKSILNTRENV